MQKAVIPLAAIAVVMAAGAPAQAAPSRDLYMVKHLENQYGSYTGQFIALQKKGARVAGAFGVIGSEYMCGAGSVRNGRFYAEARRGREEPYVFKGTWKGSGAKQHIKGWKSVTRAQLTMYMSADAISRPPGVPTDPYPVLRKCAAK